MTPLRLLRGLLLLVPPILLGGLIWRSLPVLGRWTELERLAHHILVDPPAPEEREALLHRLTELAQQPSPPELALVLRIPLELESQDPARLAAALDDFSRRGSSTLARALGGYRAGPSGPLPQFESPMPRLARLFHGWRLAFEADATHLERLLGEFPPESRCSFHELYLRLIHSVRTAPRDLERAGSLLDALRHQMSRAVPESHLGFGPDAFDPLVITEGDGSLVLRPGPWRGEVVPIQESLLRRRVDVLIGLANLYLCRGDVHRSLFQAEILEKNHAEELQNRGLEGELDRLLHPRAYRSQVRSVARRYQLDPYLLYSVARQESKFQPEAGSPVGAQGLMQLMPDTAAWILKERGEARPLGVRELRDPETNLDLGGWYLRHLADKFFRKETRWEWTLAAYNAGLRHATRWLNDFKQRVRKEPQLRPQDVIDFPETQGYVEKVLASQERYRALYQDPEG